MLGLTRNIPKRAAVSWTRGLAEAVPVKSISAAPVTKRSKAATRILEQGRVPVKEDHGLWAFFRRKQGEDLVGEARYETVEHPHAVDQGRTGRAWRPSELRLKSFEDLHTLWYVTLRERNLLATQKEEARRMGVNDQGLQVSSGRVQQCRKTMARIKSVLNERRLAYEGAMKIIERQREEEEDTAVLQYQRQQHKEEQKHILSRRELTERRREAWLKSQQASAEETEDAYAETAPTADGRAQADVLGEAQTGPDVVQAQSSETVPQSSVPAEGSARIETSEDAKTAEQSEKKAKEIHRKSPANPADAAADALFGGGRRR